MARSKAASAEKHDKHDRSDTPGRRWTLRRLMLTINADPTNVVVSIGQAYIAVQAARHATSPSRPDFDALPDSLGGWPKRFGTTRELDYHSLIGKIPSEE